MWALPDLESVKSSNIDNLVSSGGLWSMLLFDRADESILKGLEQNWWTFSEAIGPNAHIITLLEIKEDRDRVSLNFPSNYEKLVGVFCRELSIRIDSLPVLISLNVCSPKDGKPIYWSLARNSQREGSDALRQLVSDIQQATDNLRHQSLDGQAEWLDLAAKNISRYQMGATFQKIVVANTDTIIAALKKLIGGI